VPRLDEVGKDGRVAASFSKWGLSSAGRPSHRVPRPAQTPLDSIVSLGRWNRPIFRLGYGREPEAAVCAAHRDDGPVRDRASPALVELASLATPSRRSASIA
jgi:hypothetical protein